MVGQYENFRRRQYKNKNSNLGSINIRNETWKNLSPNLTKKMSNCSNHTKAMNLNSMTHIPNFDNYSEMSRNYQPIRSHSYQKSSNDEVRALQDTISRLNKFENYVTPETRERERPSYEDTLNRLNKFLNVNAERPNFSKSCSYRCDDVKPESYDNRFRIDRQYRNENLPSRYSFNERSTYPQEEKLMPVDNAVEEKLMDFKRYKDNASLQTQRSDSKPFNSTFHDPGIRRFSPAQEVADKYVPSENTNINISDYNQQNNNPFELNSKTVEQPQCDKSEWDAAINNIIMRHISKNNSKTNGNSLESTNPIKYFPVNNNSKKPVGSCINTNSIDSNQNLGKKNYFNPTVVQPVCTIPNIENMHLNQNNIPYNGGHLLLGNPNDITVNPGNQCIQSPIQQQPPVNWPNNSAFYPNYNPRINQSETPQFNTSYHFDKGSYAPFMKEKIDERIGKYDNKKQVNGIDYQAKYYQLLNDYHKIKEQMQGKSTTDTLTQILNAISVKETQDPPLIKKPLLFKPENKSTCNNGVNTIPEAKKIFHEMGIQTDAKNPFFVDKDTEFVESDILIEKVRSNLFDKIPRKDSARSCDPSRISQRHHCRTHKKCNNNRDSAIYVEIPDGNSHSFSETFSSLSTADMPFVGEKTILTKIKKYLQRVLPKVSRLGHHSLHNAPANKKSIHPTIIDQAAKDLCEKKIKGLQERQNSFNYMGKYASSPYSWNVNKGNNVHENNLLSYKKNNMSRCSLISSSSDKTKEDSPEFAKMKRTTLINSLYNNSQ